METRNLTLALPSELVQRAKVTAAERGTSVSALVTELLTDLVNRHRRLRAARVRYRALATRPRNLGTEGRAGWSREDLHDR